MRQLRQSVNPKTGQYHTFDEIGKAFGMTRQRANQLLGNGKRVMLPYPQICEACSGHFSSDSKHVRFCSKRCSSINRQAKHRPEELLGIPNKQFTLEQKRIYYKWRKDVIVKNKLKSQNSLNVTIEDRRENAESATCKTSH